MKNRSERTKHEERPPRAGNGAVVDFLLSSYHIFSAKNLEATIIRDLLNGYDPQAFPVDEDKSIVVNVSYFLVQLQGLVS